MEDGDKRAPLLDSPQRRVMTRLTRDDEIDVRLLQHVVPAPRADGKAPNARILDRGAHGARDHDVPQPAKSCRQPVEDVDQGHAVGRAAKVADGAVAGWRVVLRGGGAGHRDRSPIGMGPRYDIREPGVQALGCGVDGCVWAVDCYACAGEVDEGGLLGVIVGDALQAGEDEWVWFMLSDSDPS